MVPKSLGGMSDSTFLRRALTVVVEAVPEVDVVEIAEAGEAGLGVVVVEIAVVEEAASEVDAAAIAAAEVVVVTSAEVAVEEVVSQRTEVALVTSRARKSRSKRDSLAVRRQVYKYYTVHSRLILVVLVSRQYVLLLRSPWIPGQASKLCLCIVHLLFHIWLPEKLCLFPFRLFRVCSRLSIGFGVLACLSSKRLLVT